MQLKNRLNRGNYRGTQVIDKKGIEKTWEKTLHGRTGIEEVEVAASGLPVRTLSRVDPVPGASLRLSLDIGLQKMAEGLFAGRRGGRQLSNLPNAQLCQLEYRLGANPIDLAHRQPVQHLGKTNVQRIDVPGG
ncbi:penicillin-binding protein [Alcaligenes faecalis subsp. faecalis NCIB 8687]|nr:penicillin-binding protein [Alcaligenes faecalis subsp. faecalis NCIB 8687]